MKRFVIAAVLIFLVLRAASGQKISLELSELLMNNDSLEVTLIYKNEGERLVCFYLSDESDICSPLLSIKAVNNLSISNLEPCEYLINLDSYTVPQEKVISLNKGEKHKSKLKFSKFDFAPYLSEGQNYKIIVVMDLENTIYSYPRCNLFKGQLNCKEIL